MESSEFVEFLTGGTGDQETFSKKHAPELLDLLLRLSRTLCQMASSEAVEFLTGGTGDQETFSKKHAPDLLESPVSFFRNALSDGIVRSRGVSYRRDRRSGDVFQKS